MAHNIPGQLSYLDSCRTWTVVAPGQLSYLDSCRTWTVVTWTVVAWTVVAWTDVGASFRVRVFIPNKYSPKVRNLLYLSVNKKIQYTVKHHPNQR